jgi:hypothetical protein
MWVYDSSVGVSIALGDAATSGLIMDECNSGSKASSITGVIIHLPSFVCSLGVLGLWSIPTIARAQFGVPEAARAHGNWGGLRSIETPFKVCEICHIKNQTT